MYAYTEKNKNGECVNARGVRYVLHMASRLYSDKRSCWQEFESREAAMAHFGLKPYLDPKEAVEAQLLTETNDYGNE